MQTIPAGKFKSTCLAVMAEVNATGKPVMITKRGKPLARIFPSHDAEQKEKPESIFGALRGMVTVNDDFGTSIHTDEEWEEMFNKKWPNLEPGQ